MKKEKAPYIIAIVCVVWTFIVFLFNRYGGFKVFGEPMGRMAGVEYFGVSTTVIMLISPIPCPSFKPYIWTKKALIYIFAVLLIDLLILSFMNL